jgi:hypothetical protein
MRNEFFNRINPADPPLQGRGFKPARVIVLAIVLYAERISKPARARIYIALSGRNAGGDHFPQGDAIGLGYTRLSALPNTVRFYRRRHFAFCNADRGIYAGHSALSHPFFIAT